MEHIVYALIKNKKPVYVGCTAKIDIRIKCHKRNKDFDSFVIIEKFDNKRDAYICERGIVKFVSLQNDDYNINSKYINFKYLSLYTK